MSKFFHYLFGLALVVYGVVLFNWFYLNDFYHAVTHLANPQYFARLSAPIASIYLGLFYLYSAIKNKIDSSSKFSLRILIIGLLVSIVLIFSAPVYFGGPSPFYSIVMRQVGGILLPLSIIIAIIFSFISLFKSKKNNTYGGERS